MTKYKLTPEHKAQLKPWADKWIENCLSTKPMDDLDRSEMKKAIKGLYEAAGLTPPPDHRIVFVPSPMCARFAGGFASSIWWKRKNTAPRDATYAATYIATRAATHEVTIAATIAATDDATIAATDAATYAATRNATFDATRDATYAATNAATRGATDAATRAATYDAINEATYAAAADATYEATYGAIGVATRDVTNAAINAATDDATRDATDDATYNATDDATYNATDDATYEATNEVTYDAPNEKWYTDPRPFIDAGISLNVGKFGFECASMARNMYQGGNFWSGWTAFLSFFRHVVKLPLDYSKFEHWEKATIHGSYRIMHPEFCMISDRPRVLKLDDQGRPHCEDGPYIQWADGTGFFAWHGVRIPEYWITHRHLLTPEMAITWENVEQRRCIAEIVGWHNVLEKLNAKTIDKDSDPLIGELLEVDIPDVGREKFLKVKCGTGRTFALPCPPEMETALEAQAWLNFCTTDDILGIEFRT